MKYFALVLAMLFCTTLHAQTIKGTVRDSIAAVPFANILIKKKSNPKSVYLFASTDENGHYNIQPKFQLDSLIVEVTSLAHEPAVFDLNKFKPEQNTLLLNVNLKERTSQLKEVIITKKPAITVKKDTLEYNLERYKDGTEKVAEDVLKKLPGVKVESNGEIKYKGKTIKKLLLDGDDLFDSQYSLGSKNISADMIEKVQGIDHYEENSLLKGIRDSDDVALNLVLKKGKTDFSGNTTLGYGYKENFYGNLSGMLVNKKHKGFSLASYNNIGQNNTPYNFDSSIVSLESINNKDILAKELISQGDYSSSLDPTLHRLNKTTYFSYNHLMKTAKNSTLKFNVSYYQDQLTRKNENTTEYQIGEDHFTVIETNTLIKKPFVYDGRIHYSNKEKKNFHWEYLSKVNYQPTIFNDFSNNNGTQQENKVTTKPFAINQELNATLKMSELSALTSKFNYSFSEAPQQYETNPGTPIDFNGNTTAQNQYSNYKKEFLNLRTLFLAKKEQFNFGVMPLVVFSKSKLRSLLKDSYNQSLGDAFENNNQYTITSYGMNTSVSYKNDKNLAFKFSLVNAYNTLELNDYQRSIKSTEKGFVVTPRLIAKYIFGQRDNLSFLYSYNQITPEEDKLFTGIVQSSYRGFSSNELALAYLKTHTYRLDFAHNNFFKLTQYAIAFEHNYHPNNYFSKTLINQNITVFNSFYANIGNKDYTLSANGMKYLHPLLTTFFINGNYTLSLNKNIVNTSELRTIENRVLFIDLTGRTGFKSRLNLENKTSFSQNHYEVKNTALKSNFQSFSNQTKLIYKHSDVLKAYVLCNYTMPGLHQKNYAFVESEITYEPKNKSLSYALVGKNLTNNNTFKTQSISDISSSRSTYNLMERYIMFKLTASF
ncbi:carboxypeptidase-like regulatory domain-containing protein [Flavobacterium sp. SM15]|uniref:carboxypeptidase-like regulatory domain-containing protein n=1 Tax=Flavobacterium sp. SM15 TaxID=2908005 RepID=UPI001EDAF30C|nr:carboxypeptidase-like regulatory domain-containing protein [Flavobacterium sp. SM15]MCG2610144.1 carboxypeptidase-like regulatory domain-containing protein [Flavobacterium sp. SM15]